jgi:hypothetical protein
MRIEAFQPKWWSTQHATQWETLKDALRRDWEQTKADLHLGGRDLNQGLRDTLDQAAGAEPAPPRDVANFDAATNGRHLTWDYAEPPLRYGVGARDQFGALHMEWDTELESKLQADWEASRGAANGTWADVKLIVRHGYERARR